MQYFSNSNRARNACCILAAMLLVGIGLDARARANGVQNIWIMPGGSGWGQTKEGVMRTDDGGSWRLCLRVGPSADCVFRDGKRAYVAVTAEGKPGVTIWCTRDGGRRWIRQRLATRERVVYDSHWAFAGNSAWLMVIPEHGMSSSPGTLYRTTDGGRHWRIVSSTADGRLPYGGQISFRNSRDGRLVGGPTTTSPQEVSVTHDGGRTWRRAK